LLAVGGVCVLAVVSAIVAFYDPPESSFNGEGFRDVSEQKRDDYNRNVSLILTAAGTSVLAVACFGLNPRVSPLRTGLLAGGLGLYLTGMGFWADSSNQWIGFVMSIVVLAALLGSYPWLETGLPMRGRFQRGSARPPGAPPPEEAMH
jgi:hypothetical protein